MGDVSSLTTGDGTEASWWTERQADLHRDSGSTVDPSVIFARDRAQWRRTAKPPVEGWNRRCVLCTLIGSAELPNGIADITSIGT